MWHLQLFVGGHLGLGTLTVRETLIEAAPERLQHIPSDEVQTGIILWLEHDTHLENKLELAMVCCFDTNVGSFKAGAPLPVRTKLPRVLKPRNTSDQRWRQPLLGSSDQNLRICLFENHLLDLMPGKHYPVV